MSLDDISHAAHVGHLQGRIGELEAKLRKAEERAAKAERERDVREANLSTALWDLDRARTALGGLGHPSGDVALGIGVLKELYEKCGRYLDEAQHSEAALEQMRHAHRRDLEGREKAEREMAAILDALPADVVVRVREGAGPESVAASLAVSVVKLRERMETAERECGRLQKMLDVCSVVHGHNVKLKSERDAARERLEGASILWHREKHAGLWEDCKRDICVADRDALGEEP